VGVAQVGLILMLTVVGLPCAFFTLLALLDRFERSLSPTRVADHIATTAPASVETTADVVSLPIHLAHPAVELAVNPSSAAAV